MTRKTDQPIRDLEDFAGIASDWFWETDAQHRYTFFTSRITEVCGVPAEDALGRCRIDITPDDISDQAWQKHLEDLEQRRPFRDFEFRVHRSAGQGDLWVRSSGQPVFAPDGTFLGYRGVGHDITLEKETMLRLAEVNAALAKQNQELNALKRELELAAIEDPLTGLQNRRAFDTAIEDALNDRAPRLTLFLIDLDHFKAVNDTHGHQAGDMVLVTAADRIAGQIGAETPVYRMGGDEFAVMLDRPMSLLEADGIGHAVIRALCSPIDLGPATVTVGASVGYAIADNTTWDAFSLMSRADAALYAAKHAGRNCVKSVA